MSSDLDLDQDRRECYQQMTNVAASKESLKGLVNGGRVIENDWKPAVD